MTTDISQTSANSFEFEEHLSDDVAITMLWIPPGSFLMGSKTEFGRQMNESPQHLVQLQGYFMGQTPITQAQWREVMGNNPSRFNDQPDSDQRPVENVSWHDAHAFCGHLTKRTGRCYALPTESKWEYACRAGTSTPFYFGETITTELANFDGNSTYRYGARGIYRKQTTAVGMFPANAWGLKDMHGNVYEWCLDDWHGSYERAPTDGSAWLDGEAGQTKLLRGGSWEDGPKRCRSAYRDRYLPGVTGFNIGFRVVCLVVS